VGEVLYLVAGFVACAAAAVSLFIGVRIESTPLAKLSDRFMSITTLGGNRQEWYLRMRISFLFFSGCFVLLAVLSFRHV
jgi:hypothetical protein